MGQFTNSEKPAKKRYRITQFLGDIDAKDQPEDTAVVTLEGACPNCASGENSLIILNTKAISPTVKKFYFRCLQCDSDEGSVLLNM
jgi:hypothetical protein